MKTYKPLLTNVFYGFVASTAIFMVSCAPQSNYKQPKIDIPTHYRGQDTLNMPLDSVGIRLSIAQ